MELSRSNSYSVHSFYTAATKQAEMEAYLEYKLQQEQLEEKRQIKSDIDAHVTGRRRTQEIDPHAARPTTVEVIVKRDESIKAPPTRNREPLPLGQASSPFLAQHISQQENVPSEETLSHANDLQRHHSAIQAYKDTRNLTISLLGFQGFQERVV